MTRGLLVALLLAAPLGGQEKPLLTPKAYGQWETLGQARLSPDGAWVTYGISRVNDENELRISNRTSGAPPVIVAFGLLPTFSADSRWVAYMVGVSPKERDRYYPANYDAKKKYPMIVYTYERLSQGYHRSITPRENDYYNANVFTQHGYFVLMPDIVFRPREPGIAVLQSVEPAVRAVVARGLVDAAKVGHAGHSQGGYEAAYLATHSKLFTTTVMGSGSSDMISFAGQIHWNSVPEFDHWETGQFRMEVPPWEDMAAMVNNSPLNKVHQMHAKSVLVEIGGEDPTVDMRQGVEFYNYARRAGKHVVMLLYPGDGHSLARKENAGITSAASCNGLRTT